MSELANRPLETVVVTGLKVTRLEGGRFELQHSSLIAAGVSNWKRREEEKKRSLRENRCQCKQCN